MIMSCCRSKSCMLAPKFHFPLSMSPMPQTLSGELSGTFVSGTVSQFKVTVTVDKEMFLVGIADPHFTVNWLAKHVAGRYFIETGTKVTLRIRDSDGAKLQSEDLLGIVLANGDKLTSDVFEIPDVDSEGCCCTLM